MTIEQQLQLLNETENKLYALKHAQSMLHWDSALKPPKNSVKGRAFTLSVLSGEYYKTLLDETFVEAVQTMLADPSSFSDVDQKRLSLYMEEIDKIKKIPLDVYTEYSSVVAQSSQAWEEAKEANDFSLFAPHLKAVIDFNRQFINYRGYEGHPNNTLLNDYERGLTVETVDTFFAHLKKELVPLIKQISEADPLQYKRVKGIKVSVEKQREISKLMMKLVQFNTQSGMIAESEHPFTLNFNTDDVRITTHYYDDDMLNGYTSTLHELGHALYEQHVNKDFEYTILAGGVSMGIHESQSRFFENIIGRSRSFIQYFLPIVRMMVGVELDGLTDMDVYLELNRSEKSLIRIEADELTYPLHIMIRYEIEKMIFDGAVQVEDLPQLWNQKYEEYLGLVPPNDKVGILQDVHWSEGLFGYFPSYALGSAYASQFAHYMNKEVVIEALIGNGNLGPINDWLKQNIHQYGCLKNPGDILQDATGEAFNPKYYTNYLKNKFKAIYKIQD